MPLLVKSTDALPLATRALTAPWMVPPELLTMVVRVLLAPVASSWMPAPNVRIVPELVMEL